VGVLLTIAVGMFIYCCLRWRRQRQARRHVEFQFHKTVPKDARSLHGESRSGTRMFSPSLLPVAFFLIFWIMADKHPPQSPHASHIVEKQHLTYRHRLLPHTHLLPARTKNSNLKRSWAWG
jgi:hypothetical protein